MMLVFYNANNIHKKAECKSFKKLLKRKSFSSSSWKSSLKRRFTKWNEWDGSKYLINYSTKALRQEHEEEEE